MLHENALFSQSEARIFSGTLLNVKFGGILRPVYDTKRARSEENSVVSVGVYPC